MGAVSKVTVEIAFAIDNQPHLLSMRVAEGTTVAQAFDQAITPVLKDKCELEWLRHVPLGIHGEQVKDPEHTIVKNADRIEAYAPLKIDPKAARKARASRR